MSAFVYDYNFYICRVKLQDIQSNNLPSNVDEPTEPTHDIIDGVQMVNITPNPAYGTSSSGKRDVKMTPNPVTSVIKKAEDPSYI